MQSERPERLFAAHALTSEGWQQGVEIVLAEDGTIASVTANVAQSAGQAHALLLPGMANVHSHAFQYVLAGLTEMPSPRGENNFWSWRQAMYESVAELTPERMREIATQLYAQLLRHGYTSVGEFHYVHHAPGGTAYDDPAEMSLALIEAANATGIHLTLLPVMYESSDFGGKLPEPHQQRFVHSVEGYLTLMEALQKECSARKNVTLGAAFHSLRAVTPETMQEILYTLPEDMPKHIHIAEQVKEVEACVAQTGLRPVEWLLENVSVDERWCLIHATHMNDKEVKQLAGSGAVVGLCPTTEANLGDGIFPAEAYVKAGGRYAIGSDSHVGVDPLEELRLLEYSQRLALQQRNVLAEGGRSTGCSLYAHAARGGAQAGGVNGGEIAVGRRADLVAFNLPPERSGDAILDTLVFSPAQANVTDVYVAGKRMNPAV